MMWLAYAVVWLSVSFATCFGIYITKSAWCLWAFILPMCVKLTQKGNDNNTNIDNNNDKEDKE